MPAMNSMQTYYHRPMVAASTAGVLILFCGIWMLHDAPFSGTEALRVIPGHEMLADGDWIMPQLYGEDYLRKPPLQFWVLGMSEAVFGSTSQWVYRLPSVLAWALTAVAVSLFAGRWFGIRAAWGAGLSTIGLVALWSQGRSADIDSGHTLAVTVASLTLIEMGFGSPKRRWAWAGLLSAALTAVLLYKGHAGLPMIGGALIGASLLCRQWRWLVHPSVWLPFIVAIVLTGLWVLAVYFAIDPQAEQADSTGVMEMLYSLLAWDRLAAALRMPLELIAFALPLALVLPWVLRVAFGSQQAEDEAARHRTKLVRALIGTWLVATGIFVINGVTNPRYGYITMPLWPVFVGLVVQLWPTWSAQDQKVLRMLASGTMIVLLIGHIVMAVVLWPVPLWLMVNAMAACIFAAVGLGLWMAHRVRAGALCMVFVMAMLSLSFAEMKNRERLADSAYLAAKEIRQMLDEDEALHIGFIHRRKPEILWYAERPVAHTPGRLTEPRLLDASGWYLMGAGEARLWVDTPFAEQFTQMRKIPAGNSPVWLMYRPQQRSR